MGEIASKTKEDLNENDRNLISVAFKQITTSKRSSYRILKNIKDEAFEGKQERIEARNQYLKAIAEEIVEICDDVVDIIDKYVLPFKNLKDNNELNVFFLKMKGDYLRYKAEVTPIDERGNISIDSFEAYTKASEAASNLPPTNSVKLGLALNFSVFHYEIRNGIDQASRIAKRAFDSAMNKLDNISESHYKDSTLIMQLLRDNLTLWRSRASNGDIKINDKDGNEFETDDEEEADEKTLVLKLTMTHKKNYFYPLS